MFAVPGPLEFLLHQVGLHVEGVRTKRHLLNDAVLDGAIELAIQRNRVSDWPRRRSGFAESRNTTV